MTFVLASVSSGRSFETCLCLVLPHHQNDLKSHSDAPQVAAIRLHALHSMDID